MTGPNSLLYSQIEIHILHEKDGRQTRLPRAKALPTEWTFMGKSDPSFTKHSKTWGTMLVGPVHRLFGHISRQVQEADLIQHSRHLP